MYPIPPHEYRKRLARVRQAPDYRRKSYRERERGAGVVEHWSDGCCQLRALVYRDGWEPYGRKGVPGYVPKDDGQGPIAFKCFNEPIRDPPKVKPLPPDVIDWAE